MYYFRMQNPYNPSDPRAAIQSPWRVFPKDLTDWGYHVGNDARSRPDVVNPRTVEGYYNLADILTALGAPNHKDFRYLVASHIDIKNPTKKLHQQDPYTPPGTHLSYQ
jgi:hypothetical protein